MTQTTNTTTGFLKAGTQQLLLEILVFVILLLVVVSGRTLFAASGSVETADPTAFGTGYLLLDIPTTALDAFSGSGAESERSVQAEATGSGNDAWQFFRSISSQEDLSGSGVDANVVSAEEHAGSGAMQSVRAGVWPFYETGALASGSGAAESSASSTANSVTGSVLPLASLRAVPALDVPPGYPSSIFPQFHIPAHPWIVSLDDLVSRLTVRVTDARQVSMNFYAKITEDTGGYRLTIIPEVPIAPGLFSVRITLEPARGVVARTLSSIGLAMTEPATLYDDTVPVGMVAWNTDKDHYTPGETVSVTASIVAGTGALCGQEISMSVQDPSGDITHVTPDGSEVGTQQICTKHAMPYAPDYHRTIPVQGTGTYILRLTTASGAEAIRSFTVGGVMPLLSVERSAVVRTEPDRTETMTLTIIPTETFIGEIRETVPRSLTIDVDDLADIESVGGAQNIVWSKRWEQGKAYTLQYQVHGSTDAPALMLLGPVTAQGTREYVPPSPSDSSEFFESASSSLPEVIETVPQTDDTENASDASESSSSSASSSEASSEQDEHPLESSSFFRRIFAGLSRFVEHALAQNDDVNDILSEVSFTESRSWELLMVDVIVAAVSESDSEFEMTALTLTPTQSVFEAQDSPTFTMLDVSLPGTDGSTLSTDAALSALVNATTSDDAIAQTIVESIIDAHREVIAQEIVADSATANDLRSALGSDVGSVRRSDVLQAHVSDTIQKDDVLSELASNVLGDENVDALAAAVVTDDIRSAAVAAAVANDQELLTDRLEERASEAIDDLTTSVVSVLAEQTDTAESVVDHVKISTVSTVDLPIVTVSLKSADGTVLSPKYHFEHGSVLLVLEPMRNFIPGIYTLTVTVTNPITGESQTFIQDFAWGVLAMNSDKDVYHRGDTARIDFGVLDDHGEIICDAGLALHIVAPDGSVQDLSTDDDSIVTTGSCGIKQAGFIEPDFTAQVLLTQSGAYHLTLEGTINGTSRSISSTIIVNDDAPFVITRSGATRLWPFAPSPMTIGVLFKAEVRGHVVETLPSGFTVTDVTPFGVVSTGDDGIVHITWHGSWISGESAMFHYSYKAPEISPYFFLLGPLRIQSDVLFLGAHLTDTGSLLP